MFCSFSDAFFGLCSGWPSEYGLFCSALDLVFRTLICFILASVDLVFVFFFFYMSADRVWFLRRNILVGRSFLAFSFSCYALQFVFSVTDGYAFPSSAANC